MLSTVFFIAVCFTLFNVLCGFYGRPFPGIVFREQTKLYARIDIHSKGIELTDNLKDLVENKISKATKKLDSDIVSIHVSLKAPTIPKSGEIIALIRSLKMACKNDCFSIL
jgi:hypothetical protein